MKLQKCIVVYLDFQSVTIEPHMVCKIRMITIKLNKLCSFNYFSPDIVWLLTSYINHVIAPHASRFWGTEYAF